MSNPGRSLANNARGRWGEDVAARWYQQRGFEVLARNWRSAAGEIDLIMAGHGMLVFCEVKTRASASFGIGAEAVTRVKQVRIRRLAAEWMAQQAKGWPQVRYDVASITGVRIDVLEDAF